jgi:hypothetical protein
MLHVSICTTISGVNVHDLKNKKMVVYTETCTEWNTLVFMSQYILFDGALLHEKSMYTRHSIMAHLW